MMRGDRVDIVRALFERWNSGDRGSAVFPEYFDPSIELISPFSSVVGEPYRGYSGLERWVSDLDEQFTLWSISADEVRDTGSRVFARTTISARGRASDIALQFPSAGIIEFAGDDRLARIRIYLDVGEALAEMGLAE
jgi:SnoaL-like domain